ncbi:proteoglycan 4 isoform X2 [Coccinella septempunctata]|uniref:proteoglycan 4 isoform X2 n=1 Tax=Coccinella septempunctata TaxID=41139 RepID=UPI001D065487|nr:proteoglycan 4 isoform X2 [Coccinella septempunctata]
MPSNKSPKQAIGVKMKQQPSRKKASVEDSVSETISFVIKGKLTPIKPAHVAKKVSVRKIGKNVTRKETTSAAEDSKTAGRDVETKEETETKPPKKNKKVVDSGSASKHKNKLLLRKTAVSVKQNASKKVVKLKKENDKMTKIIKKLKPKKLLQGTDETEKEEEQDSKTDVKKKTMVRKILKQAKEVLDRKKPKLNSKTKVVNINKPKISQRVIANKNKQVAKIQDEINEEISAPQEKEADLVVEKEETQKTSIKTENKDDSTSDDNNLEEIRRALKSGAKESQKTKEKTKKPISKNAKLQQTKKAINKIKKARLEEQKLRKLKLYGFWNGPKRKRVASLNAIAKVHCLYENEGKISMLDNPEMIPIKREVVDKSSKTNEKKMEEEAEESPPPQRSLRCLPGLRGVGKHWDMHNASSSSSEEVSSDEEPEPKKVVKVKKEPPKKTEEIKVPKKRKRKQTEIIMDLKDMVVRKRMASLNATAILAASYSQEKRNPRSPKSDRTDDTDSSDDDLTSDDEQEERKCYEDDVKKEDKVIEVHTKPNKKVAVIVNQDTDVTITGVYVNSTTRSTHHEGYCSIAGMQYRISATSHTQTAATAVATETLLQSSTSSSGPENNNAETLTPTGKSYKPLDALSNMRPPSDGAPHHGHQSIVPPQHVMAMSPSGVRHSCTSAFTAPHPSAYHHVGPGHHGPPPPPQSTINGESGYIHGYYQPAGPLITVPLGHGQPPLAKSAPLSETSPTTPSPLSSHPHPPPSNNGDSSDSEVIITSVTAGKDVGPPPPPPQGHSSYRYQYPPNVPPANYSYPYSSHYYHPSPAPPSYPPHDVCYSPGPYVHHKFPPTSYRRYLGGPQYYPPNPPPSQEIYAMPAHAQPSQQVVTTTPVSGSGTPYQNPLGPTASSTILEQYPPTLVETYPAHYYTGYPPGPPSTCYSHAPPPRAVPFINGAYQNCPCPMQSCPKNGLTGPLTGDSKRSSTLPKGNMPPLPPVALALPKEPTSDGPPSPARGSAGMPPPPSPAGATYQQQPTPPTKQESISPENQMPIEKKRKARVGKAMVRSNMQNTMLLMCNPSNINCVKREIESPKEKEVIIVPDKEDVALNIESKIVTKLETPSPPRVEPEIVTIPEPVQTEPVAKIEEKPVENPKQEETILEPVLSTVGENVKVKNMKRKLSLSVERKEENSTNPKKQKTEVKVNGSYKNLIKRNTSSVKINNGKRKLIQESKLPHNLLPRATALRRKAQNKRKLCSSKQTANTNAKKSKQSKSALSTENNTKQNCKSVEDAPPKDLVESKENIKRGSTQPGTKSNQKQAANVLDNLIAKNNVDRTIECVISDAIRTSTVSKKTEKVKEVKEPPVPTSVTVKKSTKKTCRQLTTSRKSKSKNVTEVVPTKPLKSLNSLRWSNGWNWEGDSYEAKVFLNSDETTVIRKCYPSMRHHSGDLIEVKDCVLLKAGARRNELPFVAKIAALWENPEDGEMMMSLLWYYRPEHTEQGRVPADQPDEVFASRHKDSNSVACIDDKCYVLTFNEYCRYRKSLRRIEEGIEEQISTCIPISESYPRSHRQPPQNIKISPEMVFFCRRVYDFRQKRIIKNPS